MITIVILCMLLVSIKLLDYLPHWRHPAILPRFSLAVLVLFIFDIILFTLRPSWAYEYTFVFGILALIIIR